MFKIKLVTTDSSLKKWRTLDSKLKRVTDALNLCKNGTFEIDIEHRNLIPTIEEGRVPHWWMDTISYDYYAEGYDFVALHMSEDQKNEWGLIPGLRGSHQRDNDDVSELYFWADQYSRREGENQFEQVFMHEMSHALAHMTEVPDTTHDYHKKNPDITGIFSMYDMKRFKPELKRQISWLKARINELLFVQEQTVEKLHPILKGSPAISQKYGEKNDAYSLTGRHIGNDYPVPIGTRIYAPADGEVTTVGFSGSLGFYCYYQFIFRGQTYTMRLLHQMMMPKIGKYTKGDIIGYTGSTGFSTGPHLHEDVWLNEVNIGEIGYHNWDKLTVDSRILYV